MDNKNVVEMLIALLDDASGISYVGYEALTRHITDIYKGFVPQEVIDIFDRVRCTEDRCYLIEE